MNDESIIGGEFLIKESNPENIFILEDFNEEQRMMADACYDFLEKEVIPKTKEIDNHFLAIQYSH